MIIRINDKKINEMKEFNKNSPEEKLDHIATEYSPEMDDKKLFYSLLNFLEDKKLEEIIIAIKKNYNTDNFNELASLFGYGRLFDFVRKNLDNEILNSFYTEFKGKYGIKESLISEREVFAGIFKSDAEKAKIKQIKNLIEKMEDDNDEIRNKNKELNKKIDELQKATKKLRDEKKRKKDGDTTSLTRGIENNRKNIEKLTDDLLKNHEQISKNNTAIQKGKEAISKINSFVSQKKDTEKKKNDDKKKEQPKTNTPTKNPTNKTNTGTKTTTQKKTTTKKG